MGAAASSQTGRPMLLAIKPWGSNLTSLPVKQRRLPLLTASLQTFTQKKAYERTGTLQVLLLVLVSPTLLLSHHSSLGKESACNAGDPGSIPGLGRSPGEGTGCPLQYSLSSLVAQLVKNPPTMRETWVRNLGWEDALEKGKAIYPLQYSGLEDSGLYSQWDHKESDVTYDFRSLFQHC